MSALLTVDGSVTLSLSLSLYSMTGKIEIVFADVVQAKNGLKKLIRVYIPEGKSFHLLSPLKPSLPPSLPPSRPLSLSLLQDMIRYLRG